MRCNHNGRSLYRGISPTSTWCLQDGLMWVMALETEPHYYGVMVHSTFLSPHISLPRITSLCPEIFTRNSRKGQFPFIISLLFPYYFLIISLLFPYYSLLLFMTFNFSLVAISLLFPYYFLTISLLFPYYFLTIL